MPRNPREPSEGMSQEDKTSRRTLLKRALMVLGAGAIMQVSGGVLRLNAAEAHKVKNESKVVKGNAAGNKADKATHKGWNKTTNKADTIKAPLKNTNKAQ